MKLALTLPGNQRLTLPVEVQQTVTAGGGYGLHFFAVAIDILYVVAIILCLFFIINGGIKIITSEGDPKNIDGARKMILYAVIGLFLVFLSYFILNIIGQFFGINFLNPFN